LLGVQIISLILGTLLPLSLLFGITGVPVGGGTVAVVVEVLGTTVVVTFSGPAAGVAVNGLSLISLHQPLDL